MFRRTPGVLSFALLTSSVNTAIGYALQYSAVVYDMETRRHVPGVTVYINPKGTTVTDRYGRFTVSGQCSGVTLSHVR